MKTLTRYEDVVWLLEIMVAMQGKARVQIK
jgi:hypothetical protein